jgi:uncharacterized protein (DUF2235 family)
MPKNIVICCDGTGNEIEMNLSNVLKLYRCLKKDSSQVVFYDTGIGTVSEADQWRKIRNALSSGFAQATGYGLDRNVIDAYTFLVNNYEKGDNVYLFGFSRGAYTARVLAGFLRVVGLMHPDQQNLFDYALSGYKKAFHENDMKIGWRLKDILEAKYLPIKFLGIWDTVSSVIIPGIYPSLQQLARTSRNVTVEVIRHAIAIDERRRMFRSDHWDSGQLFKRNPLMNDFHEDVSNQDLKEVWFAGDHSDVGGGYPESESGIAKFPLKWMMDEAKIHGLKIKTQMYNHLASGRLKEGANQNYVAPDPTAKLHQSLSLGWWPLEILPRSKSLREWAKRKSVFGFYIPLGEPRFITEHSTVHSSVLDRKKLVDDYDPLNLPENYSVEP